MTRRPNSPSEWSLSLTSTRSPTLRNSRGGQAPDVHRSPSRGVCLAAGASGHHRAPARRSRTSITPGDVRADRRCAAEAAAPVVDSASKGDPRPELTGARRGGAPGPMHARPRRRRRDHEPGRVAARRQTEGLKLTSSRGSESRGVRVSLFVDPRPGADRGRLGRRRPGRALYRAVCRARSRQARRRPGRSESRRCGLAGLVARARCQRRATTSTSTPHVCSGVCRSSTRCRSATPSSRARSSASIPSCAQYSMFCRPA